MDQVNIKRQANAAPAPAARVRRRHRAVWPIIAGVLIVVLLAVGIVAKMTFMKHSGFAGEVKKQQYQAVFLTNGQVYFGKIASQNHDGLKLTDIYYLQVQQNVQPADKNAQQNLSLAKLGGELHGPEDSMFVSDKQVLFWENLKDDSQVVKAIKGQNK